MVALGIGVKVATLPVIALGVGIGVDYALYLLSVQLAQQRAGLPLARGLPARGAVHRQGGGAGRHHAGRGRRHLGVLADQVPGRHGHPADLHVPVERRRPTRLTPCSRRRRSSPPRSSPRSTARDQKGHGWQGRRGGGRRVPMPTGSSSRRLERSAERRSSAEQGCPPCWRAAWRCGCGQHVVRAVPAAHHRRRDQGWSRPAPSSRRRYLPKLVGASGPAR